MDYFPHDTDSMSDDKVLALRMDCGLEAVACYWAVLEKIYRDEAPLNLSETNVGIRSVLLLCGIGFEAFSTYVSKMVEVGLLYRLDGTDDYMSERAEAQIEALEKKRETARRNGKNGGRKPRQVKRRNQRETNVGSESVATSGATSGHIKTENIKHKRGGAADGAGAVETAPPSAPSCPRCGAGMTQTASHRNGKRMFLCMDCYEEAWA